MHELSVTESILNITLRHAQEAGAARVTDLHLVIGKLASIVDDSVQFYWDIVSEGTLAEGAKLHFERMPVELLCLDCKKCYTPPGDDFACPDCGGMHFQIATGEEFFLDSIEIE